MNFLYLPCWVSYLCLMSTPVNLGKQTLFLSEIIAPVKCFLILLFSFLLFLPYTGSSQNKARLMIKGCVIDENNKKIMGAKLTLYKNSRKVYTKTTSSTGKFEFALETNYKYRNEYILEVIKKSYPVKKYKFSFGVLNDHAPLISTLKEGEIKIVEENSDEKVFDIKGGVVEVLNNKIIVLAEAPPQSSPPAGGKE